jgi:TetR/AcrR family transcriptional regulator, regulator of cefoperazone and chloramphenicol sensitivity
MASPTTVHKKPVESRGETRQRLLDAAEAMFARHGFPSTSVRDLTAEAGCNIAAINYHFGGKDNLYREMFRRLLGHLRELRIRSIDRARPRPGMEPALEELLAAFTLAFLEPLVGDVRGRRYMQLISWELVDPHLPPELFISEMMGPVEKALGEAIREAAGRELTVASVRLCIHSLVAQLVHAANYQRFQERTPRAKASPFAYPGVVDHIVRFTAAGIRSYVAGTGDLAAPGRPGAGRKSER